MQLRWDIYNPDSDAPVILVLGPSLGGSSTVQWAGVAEKLKRDAVIAFVGLPGHSLTPVWDDADEPTLDQVAGGMIEAIRAIRDKVGARPVVFAGLSISGAIALHLARDYADELAGIAVVASAAKIGDSNGWLQRAERIEDKGTIDILEDTESRWFMPSFRAQRRKVVDNVMETLASADDHSYAQLCRALAVHDMRNELGDIRLPVLVIGGERDTSTPIEGLEYIAETVPGAELRMVPDVAHLVSVAAPGEVAVHLQNFMSRVARPVRREQNDD